MLLVVGIDVHFMNRAGASGVSDVSQVGPLFAAPPSGGTPVVGCLQRLFAQYATFPGRVLFMLVTDGEPRLAVLFEILVYRVARASSSTPAAMVTTR